MKELWFVSFECKTVVVSQDSVYGLMVADCTPTKETLSGTITMEEAEGYARLIAAAPDLLEACQIMRREWGAFGKVSQQTLNQVDSAIERAEPVQDATLTEAETK